MPVIWITYWLEKNNIFFKNVFRSCVHSLIFSVFYQPSSADNDGKISLCSISISILNLAKFLDKAIGSDWLP